jgi:hypothetical protein
MSTSSSFTVRTQYPKGRTKSETSFSPPFIGPQKSLSPIQKPSKLQRRSFSKAEVDGRFWMLKSHRFGLICSPAAKNLKPDLRRKKRQAQLEPYHWQADQKTCQGHTIDSVHFQSTLNLTLVTGRYTLSVAVEGWPVSSAGRAADF